MSNIDDVKHVILEFMDKLSTEKPGRSFTAFWIARNLSHKSSYSKEEIVESVYFLYDDGLLKKIREDKMDKFRLASKGDQVFTPSKFARQQNFSQITYYQTGGIALYGNENSIGTINQSTIEQINTLDNLIKLFNDSNLDQEKKFDTIADAETLKLQLAKKNPDKSILHKAWNTLIVNAQFVNNIAEITKLIRTAYPFIKHYVPELPPITDYEYLA